MSGRRRQAGYVLVCTFVIVGLMVAVTIGFARHALTEGASSNATQAAFAARQAAESGLALACQTLRSGGPLADLALETDGPLAEIAFSSPGEFVRDLVVDARNGPTGVRLAATAVLAPAAGGVVPSLSGAAVSALLASGSTIPVGGAVTYADTTLSGVLELADGAALTLRNVALTGAIVTRRAVDGAPTAATIRLEGRVRVEAAAPLAGCAVVAPGASLAASADATVELHGLVAADTVSLPGAGAVDGVLVAGAPPELGAGLDRPGAGRAPRAWPDAVSVPTWELASLAFPPREVLATEAAAIASFPFPAAQLPPAGGR